MTEEQQEAKAEWSADYRCAPGQRGARLPGSTD